MARRYAHLKTVSRPYRVLVNNPDGLDTWDFRDWNEAQRVYDQKTDFDTCMLLTVYCNDVKLIKQKHGPNYVNQAATRRW